MPIPPRLTALLISINNAHEELNLSQVPEIIQSKFVNEPIQDYRIKLFVRIAMCPTSINFNVTESVHILTVITRQILNGRFPLTDDEFVLVWEHIYSCGDELGINT